MLIAIIFLFCALITYSVITYFIKPVNDLYSDINDSEIEEEEIEEEKVIEIPVEEAPKKKRGRKPKEV